MVLWFVGFSVAIVWLVFRSPTADYRLVALGSLVPLVDLAFGAPRVLHALAAPVALMVIVMVAARGRRLVQRRLLGVPIGMFLHLALDGAWTDPEAFWWPLSGGWSTAEVPEAARGVAGIVVLELVGLCLCAWLFRRFRLAEPDRWARMVAEGRVGRDIVPGDVPDER